MKRKAERKLPKCWRCFSADTDNITVTIRFHCNKCDNDFFNFNYKNKIKNRRKS